MYENLFIRVNSKNGANSIEVYGPGEVSIRPIDIHCDPGVVKQFQEYPNIALLSEDDAQQMRFDLIKTIFPAEVRAVLNNIRQILSEKQNNLRLKWENKN